MHMFICLHYEVIFIEYLTYFILFYCVNVTDSKVKLDSKTGDLAYGKETEA